jgi:hypothetical protein
VLDVDALKRLRVLENIIRDILHAVPPVCTGCSRFLFLGSSLGEVGEGLPALELGILDHAWM